MSDTAEKITEAVAETAEFVSEQSAEFAEFARQLSKTKIRFGLLGTVFGATAGALSAYFITSRQAEKKYSKMAEDEIAEMAEHYRVKGRALEAQAGKKDLTELVRDRGYASEISATPPMSVQPPSSLTEVPDDSEMAEDEVEGPEGVKAVETPAPVIQNIFRETKVTHEWDWHEERKRRDPMVPYVIHVEEREEMEGYDRIQLTYYTEDDVLCENDGDRAIGAERRDALVGENNLERFGHGSGDAHIVFVRNDALESIYEIVKSPNSYAQEVHGLSHEGYDRGNLVRMRARERDEER